MSGHSRWAQIHRQKNAADAKKGALFTKLGNAVTIAAKEGGDMESNFKLRLAVEKARQANMPKDNIERAIKRGMGDLGDGMLEQVWYEGYGPAGIAMMIEALTDNRNRASSNLKHIFNEYGGSLGKPNSVSWMFETSGVILVEKLLPNLELELIDLGVQEIIHDAEGVTLYTDPKKIDAVKKILSGKGVKMASSDIEKISRDPKTLQPQDRDRVLRFFDALAQDPDVNNFYSNARL